LPSTNTLNKQKSAQSNFYSREDVIDENKDHAQNVNFNNNSEEIMFVESKVPNLCFFNENNNDENIDTNLCPLGSLYNVNCSCTIQEKDIKIVSNGICELLINYSNETEFHEVVSEQAICIEGTIFVLHYSIVYAINIWLEQSTSLSDIVSRVEFQKRCGDSIYFQHFWNDMLGIMYSKFGNDKVQSKVQRCDDFLDYCMPKFDFEDMMKNDDDNDSQLLNEINEQLQDDYHEIATSSMSLLCTHLEKEIKFAKLASQHNSLMQTLTKFVLNHFDSNHVRGALVALQFIVKSNEKCIKQLIVDFNILQTIIHLLQHKKTIVCKHALRLLASLSQNEWHISNDECLIIDQRLKQFKDEWNITNNNNQFTSLEMFSTIEKHIQKSN